MTFGPLSKSGPGSYGASNVCLSKSSGCIMLDLPELLAPARSVNGRISIVCSSTIDLNPETDSDVMAGGVFGESPEAAVRFGHASASLSCGRAWNPTTHYRRNPPDPEAGLS